ncbi:Phosphotransferase enzyme [Aspergillus fumigatus]
MDDDVRVIAKIPNPYIPQKFVTASEVATLDFLRNEPGIPVPRVFAWSSKKDQPVGVEYIIMEKAAGNELSTSWPTMDISDKVDIVSRLADIQAKIAAVDFGCYGSLFYRGDIEGGFNVPGIADQFCIGPSCDIRFWEEERRFMNAFRGPWSSSEAYATDIARREKQWITRLPKFLNIHGPLLFDLPSATGLTPQEKEENLQRYQLTQLQRLYISKFCQIDNDVVSALSFPQALSRQQLIDFSGYTWEDDGLFLFREMMIRTWREWMEFTGQPQSSCPVTFGADELASHVAEGTSWEDRRELFSALGIPIGGWVHLEHFEAKVENNA